MLYSEYFEYDPTSFTFLRNKITRSNRAVAGAPSGCFGNNDARVRFNGKIVSIARIIWELHNGPIPENFLVGFSDGDFKNLNIDNLFLQSRRKKSYVAMRKKYTGVLPIKGSFQAYAKVNGKRTYLGQFDTERKALNARNRFVDLLGVK